MFQLNAHYHEDDSVAILAPPLMLRPVFGFLPSSLFCTLGWILLL